MGAYCPDAGRARTTQVSGLGACTGAGAGRWAPPKGILQALRQPSSMSSSRPSVMRARGWRHVMAVRTVSSGRRVSTRARWPMPIKAKGLAHREPDLFSTVKALRQVHPHAASYALCMRQEKRVLCFGSQARACKLRRQSCLSLVTVTRGLPFAVIFLLRCNRHRPHHQPHCPGAALGPRPHRPARQPRRSAGPAADTAVRPACARPWPVRPWRS